MKELRLGDSVAVDLPVVIADFLGPLGRLMGVELAGIVGYNFLRRFVVTLDYPAGVLILEPTETGRAIVARATA